MIREKRKFKHGQMLNLAVAACSALVLSILPISMMVSASGDFSGGVPVLTRTARLTSPTGSVNPHGDATYEVYDSGQRELEIEAEDVNSGNGTVLTFFIDGSNVGQASLVAQKAKLKLKTELGQTVPTVNNGSTVQVKNGSTIILSGIFGGGSTPTPTVSPSPTVSPATSPSPTVSPTVSPSPSPTISPSPNGGNLFATLTGATINGVLPRGYAEYELHSSRTELEIRVYQVNLPNGTSLNVFVANSLVGQLIISGGEGRLRLRSDRGENVPVVTNGTTIEIKNGGAIILSGKFAGGGGATPTPTSTPTGQGRYFESHLSGAKVTPPVNTNADGEIKILLNQNETTAQIFGEYHRLSSSQTSAKIFAATGDAPTLVYDLGVPGGTEGHFAPKTFNITASQVQQLRTGLWFAVIGSVNNPAGEIQGRFSTHSEHSDFDGDGKDDFAVFRPSTGTWYSQNSAGFSAQAFGSADDKLVSGDYDGDGRTDAAVFRNGVWYIRHSSDGGFTGVQFGLGDDKPLRGDFDGDGRSDIAVFRPSNGVWYIQKSSGGFNFVQFGLSSDIPVAADMDGDGRNDISVFRPSNGVWYWLRSIDGQFAAAQFGQNGDVPIAGDFDGDGRADLSVFRPSNGVWYIQRSSNGTFDFRQFGLGDDIPVAGNYDGDDKTDIAVFRPSNGVWYIWRSFDGAFDFRQFGANGDIPTPAR
ncbi:MAG: FG-GAP-like repeat-containing protein [Pyrinomonadaceae bacterium]